MAALGAVVLAASATFAYSEWSRLASVQEAGALLACHRGGEPLHRGDGS